LLAYILECSRKAAVIDRLIVSTDDHAIGLVAKEYGAEVIDRPAEISGDSASSELALLHALEYLNYSENYKPDVLVFLQCTSPLTEPEDIEGTVKVLIEEKADSALAVVPFYHFLWRRTETGDAVGLNHDKSFRLNRQAMHPQFLETGAVYAMKVEGFIKARHRFFGKTALYFMPADRCFEIDEIGELRLAEAILRNRSL
jgi:CMP-N-acetylneuraminic acid synthetase